MKPGHGAFCVSFLQKLNFPCSDLFLLIFFGRGHVHQKKWASCIGKGVRFTDRGLFPFGLCGPSMISGGGNNA